MKALLLLATWGLLLGARALNSAETHATNDFPASGGARPLALSVVATVSTPVPQAPAADNSRCFVCHANYEEEQLSVVHAKANIGCVRCHGVSSPHSTDEDGLTAPDRMFPKAHVRLNCLTCHDWVKLVESDKTKVNRADLQEKPDHQAVLDGRNREKRFCTDCHGEHRLKFRTVWWDRKTHKLATSKGQRVKYNPDYTKKPGEAPAKPAASAAQ